jgi:hypothetical protein
MDEDSYLESVPAGRVALGQWLSVLERRRMRVPRVVVANRLVCVGLCFPVPRHALAGFRTRCPESRFQNFRQLGGVKWPSERL